MHSVKVLPPKTLTKSNMISSDVEEFISMAKKVKKKKTYDGIDCMPPYISSLYKKIYNNDEDIVKKGGSSKDVKVSCTVYPPGVCEEMSAGAMLSDSVAIVIRNENDEVIRSSINEMTLELLGMAGMGKKQLINDRTILFTKYKSRDYCESYFIDEYPFPIVSDYKLLSNEMTSVKLPAPPGGKENTIRLKKNRSWCFVFTRLCDKYTIEKILEFANIKDVVSHKTLKSLKKALKTKKIEDLMEALSSVVGSEDKPINEKVQNAFDTL